MEKEPLVCILDDEPEFVRALEQLLKKKSFRVITADNRRQSEVKVREQRPNMIVLGTLTPRGDAYEFHRWLKQIPWLSEVPVLVINARYEEELIKGWRREEGMQVDAVGFLAKPVDMEKLLATIERVLDKGVQQIRVLIADDHAVVRDGIRAVLDLERDMQVVGEAVNGQEALDSTVELKPDVVLMDVVMPVMNGLDATKHISQQCTSSRVLMLTQYDNEENIMAATQAGALGFIPKTAVSTQLLAGIRAVKKGQQFMPRAK